MADDDRRQRDHLRSLELPSLRSALGLGRKKRNGRTDGAATDRTAHRSAHGPERPTATETSPVEPRDPVQPIPPVDPAPPREPREPAPPPPPLEPGQSGYQVAVLPAADQEDEEAAAAVPRPGHRVHLSGAVHLPGAVVALVTGALVGLALVGLTSAGSGLCSAVRGTSSCGEPGYLVLFAITVGVVILGAVLLRTLRVPTYGSTSLLGLSLVVVVTLLALLPVIDARWMVIALPVVSMLCYLAAWWLTTTYVEPGERPR